jgi:hypothetical protein
MKKQFIAILAFVFSLILTGTAPAQASVVLVSDSPWGYNESANFTTVFGAGNYTATTYAGADVSSIFTASNSFVMLEGGAGYPWSLSGMDVTFRNYINTNSSAMLTWVGNGGHLLIQSASWERNPVTLGPGTISGPSADVTDIGQLTAAGHAAFPTASIDQTGGHFAHDYITGSGLTSFVVDPTTGKTLLAGIAYGNGYIMYSGLTTSNFNSGGPTLTNSIIEYTASVPEPSTYMLIGMGGFGILFSGYVKRRKSITVR